MGVAQLLESLKDIRLWYLQQMERLSVEDARLELAGVPVEERARLAYQARRAARLEARERMGATQERELLERRDEWKYGSSDGPRHRFSNYSTSTCARD